MGEVIFSRLYRVRAFLGILAVSARNINVARTMGLENQLALFRYIGRRVLFHLPTSVSRATLNARDRREGGKAGVQSHPRRAEIPSPSPKPGNFETPDVGPPSPVPSRRPSNPRRSGIELTVAF